MPPGYKTLVLIAHCLTTVKNCDQVYLLDRREVKARGSYEDLPATSEQFQKVVRAGSTH